VINLIKYCVKQIDNDNTYLYVAENKQDAISFYNNKKLPNSMVISLNDYIIEILKNKWKVEKAY